MLISPFFTTTTSFSSHSLNESYLESKLITSLNILVNIFSCNYLNKNLSCLDQVINSEAEDSDDVTDDVSDGGEEEEDDDDDDDEETPISGPFSTLTARPPMDIEELARWQKLRYL